MTVFETVLKDEGYCSGNILDIEDYSHEKKLITYPADVDVHCKFNLHVAKVDDKYKKTI